MVAMSAFEIGINCPNVNLVIHYQLPYSLLDYAQQTGRTGRDGSKSKYMLYFYKEEKMQILECMKAQNSEEELINDMTMMFDFCVVNI